MKQTKLFSLAICLVVSLALMNGGCDGGGGGSSCAGPIPCLTEEFGDTFYMFEDQTGDQALIFSDGEIVLLAAYYYHPHTGEPYMILIVGPVTSCYNADLITGAIDWNDNFEIDEGEILEPMDGRLRICDETLFAFDLFLLGESWHDREWTYVGSSNLINGAIRQEPAELHTDLLREFFQIMARHSGAN